MTTLNTTTTTTKPGDTTRKNENENETPSKPKHLINLLRGWPSPHLLPAAQLQAAAARVLSDPAVAVPALQYAPDEGYGPLREELARWLGALYNRGFVPAPIRPEDIAITGGASQALACVLQSFADPAYTRAVWMAAPCYFLACPIFEDAGFRGRLRAVPEDDGGIDLDALERGLREEGEKPWEGRAFKSPAPYRKLYRHIIYLVATSANPSGKTLSLARRRRLVHLAREHDALVISDDVYDLLQWPVTASLADPDPPSSSSPLPLPPLLPLLSQIDAALPPSRHNPPGSRRFPHAISNGSFSKLVGPGVRTGWIHSGSGGSGSASSSGSLGAFTLGFSQTGSNRSGGAASQFAAAVVHQMMAAGELEAHLRDVVRPALRRRHALVVRELVEGEDWVDLGVKVGSGNGVFGGYFVWLTLPAGVDAAAVAERAREENLIVAPGRLFEVSGDEEAARFPRHIRLCFSWEEEENLVKGVRRLGRVLRRMLEGSEGGQPPGSQRVEASAGEFK
ncbi:uncharacterized protein THITE_2056168 [Thermothielavioides terrestris NRRL 8126]|uniref:Aminotransferase class I/classII large domain-containing protein n=1 Tax=Thermothielavioides terrestris (strain ATCC 38088 / NRRL 8126) TaxID=578455 RepID=G2RE97_THETT|nr:uncharacterized protein THITE_2056168 [Thermothielavioides terrestris NRRL 8126]AEO70926.1 hypothetical protein THITE_2056168 [Thermothielavioides terrestris NRRL 8126]